MTLIARTLQNVFMAMKPPLHNNGKFRLSDNSDHLHAPHHCCHHWQLGKVSTGNSICHTCDHSKSHCPLLFRSTIKLLKHFASAIPFCALQNLIEGDKSVPVGVKFLEHLVHSLFNLRFVLWKAIGFPHRCSHIFNEGQDFLSVEAAGLVFVHGIEDLLELLEDLFFAAHVVFLGSH